MFVYCVSGVCVSICVFILSGCILADALRAPVKISLTAVQVVQQSTTTYWSYTITVKAAVDSRRPTALQQTPV